MSVAVIYQMHCLKLVELIFLIFQLQAYLKSGLHFWSLILLSHPHLLQLQPSGTKLLSSCPHGRAVNKSSRVEKDFKKFAPHARLQPLPTLHTSITSHSQFHSAGKLKFTGCQVIHSPSAV